MNSRRSSYSGAGPNIVGRLAAATNGHVREVYGYTPAGELSSKAMSINGVGGTLSYTYNSQGQVASVTYPTTKGLDSHGFYVDVSGAVYEYSYDSMGRPAGLVRDDTSTTMVNNVQYGPAGEMTQMVDVSANLTHTFQYNNLLQLTRTTSKYSGAVRMDIQYSYSSTQNNGKITQSQDYVTGEQVNYQYDCLQRLVSAATTGSQWGLSFTYDGFGNRLSEQATKGSAPTVYSTYDTATNRIAGYTHDANGNITHQPNGTWLTYDVESRIVSANANGTIENYAYAPDGKRVYRQAPNGTEYIFFYGVQGERIGPYLIGPYNYLMTTSSNPIVYFAGRRLGVNEDRLGSQRNPLYPYGESENAPYSEDDVFFATYVRDGTTGLDYAVNRYYSSIIGRFLSPDRYRASARIGNPQSWNRYAYAQDDPVNLYDPNGSDACDPNNPWSCFCWDTSYETSGGDLVPDVTCLGIGQTASGWGRAQTARIGLISSFYTVDVRALKAYARKFANDLLSDNFSADCAADLAKLGKTPEQWASALSSVTVLNGIWSQDPLASALPNGSVEQQIALRLNLSIASQFRPGSGTVAIASVNGPQVWIDPLMINPGDMQAGLALVAHETLHNLGLTDRVIQSDLGIEVTPITKNISDKLQKDCFPGTPGTNPM